MKLPRFFSAITALLVLTAPALASKPAAGTAINTSDPQGLAANLLAAHAVLEPSGTTLADSKGTNTATLPGSGAAIVPNSGTPYVAFSSATAGAALTSNIVFDGKTSWSLAFGGGPTNAGNQAMCFGGGVNSYIWLHDGNAFRVALEDGGGQLVEWTTTPLGDNNWVLTYTCTNSTSGIGDLRLYKNGTQVGSAMVGYFGKFTFADLGGGGPFAPTYDLIGNLQYSYIYSGRVLSAGDAANLNTNPYEIFTPATTVTITDPVANRTYWRGTSNQANITIDGAYAGGSPGNIEASVDNVNWTTIATGVTGGTYSGTLSNVSSSLGRFTLRVRWSSDHTVTASVARIGVGIIIVGAGQSNANGMGTNAQVDTSGLVSQSVGGQWVDGNDASLTALAAGIAPNLGSFWPMLGSLLATDQGVPVGIIQAAGGGTSLASGSPPSWSKSGGGAYYSRCISLVSASGVTGVDLVLFYQGEADVIANATQSDYTTAGRQLAVDFATDLPNAPYTLFVQIGDSDGSTGVEMDAIRMAQAAITDGTTAKAKGMPVIASVSNGLHLLSDTELSTAGKLMFAPIKEYSFGGTAGTGRGPKMTSVQYNTAHTLVRVTYDKALKTGSTFTTSGFAVTGNGSAATISSISYDGSNAVDLNLSGAASTPIVVSMMSGDSTAGKVYPASVDYTLPGSFGTINLPAEPFVGATASPLTSFTADETTLERGQSGLLLHVHLTGNTSGLASDWSIAVGGSNGSVTSLSSAGADPVLTVTAPQSNGTATITFIPTGSISTITVSDTTAPASVTSLTGVVASYDVTVTWSGVSGVPPGETITYRIDKNASTVVSSQSGTTYNATGVVDGDVFHVYAKDDSGNLATVANYTFHKPSGGGGSGTLGIGISYQRPMRIHPATQPARKAA